MMPCRLNSLSGFLWIHHRPCWRAEFSCRNNSTAWFLLLCSVSVLLFNTTSHCFVLVKQFRPGTFARLTQPCVSEFTRGGEHTCVCVHVCVWGVCGHAPHATHHHLCLFFWVLITMRGSEIGCERPRYKAAQPPLSQFTRDCSTPQRSKFKEVWALINLFPLCFPIAFVGGGKKELYLKAISVSPG